eukprot:PhF_6_TR9182/c0_g1_i2/m.14324/K21398/SLC11A2, DMT1, NRAMP2; natural resistance-associated macrophage protein 2
MSTTQFEASPTFYAGHVMVNADAELETIQQQQQSPATEPTGDDASVMVTIPPHVASPFHFSFRKLFVFMGPGFLMSIAYLDPGNLEADIGSGAVAGYDLLWLLLLCTILGYILQTQCVRLGVVTGKHLATHCRLSFPNYVRIPLWVMTEIAVIGSDIQEVLGSALALVIFSGGAIPLWAGTLITAADTFSFLLLEEYGIRRLEAFFCTLVFVMCITFGVHYFTRLPPQDEVMKGMFRPSLPENALRQAIGTVGSVIMPHNLYLHSAIVLSRSIDRHDNHRVKESLTYNYIESAVALMISFTINVFVVSSFAYMDYEKCGLDRSEIGLSNSGECMQQNYGDASLYLWAIGLFASGQSSTCTGTYTGQFVMQGFFEIQMPPWRRLLITRGTAIVPALCVAIYFGSTPMMDSIQQSLNVLQSMQLPFAVLALIHMTNSCRVMGTTYVNTRVMKGVLWTIIVLILSANGYLIVSFIRSELPDTEGVYVGTAIIGMVYCIFVGYMVVVCVRVTICGGDEEVGTETNRDVGPNEPVAEMVENDTENGDVTRSENAVGEVGE